MISFSTSAGGRDECLPCTSPTRLWRSRKKPLKSVLKSFLLRPPRADLQKFLSRSAQIPFSSPPALDFVLPVSVKDSANLSDIDLAQRCLQGEEAAILSLQASQTPLLCNILRSHGASEIDSKELVAELWADLLVSTPNRQPLLEKYNGSSALRTWLTAIIVNRWISQGRRRCVRARAQEEIGASIYTGSGSGPLVDPELLGILEKALRAACAAADAEAIVMLQLVHLHGLTQRELAAIWGWHETRVSRLLSGTEKQIEQSTLRSIAELDPLLKLDWDDFLQLCESTNLLLS